MEISPKYLMGLIERIEKRIWEEFNSYKNVKNYIKKWYESDNYDYENFHIFYQRDNKTIDLNETLHDINSEILIKIAIDLGIETPDFLPSIPVIKNVLKDNYVNAFDSFQKALKQIEDSPDLSVGLANSTLESIIKHILENNNISIQFNSKDTLYNLTQNILKEFSLFPNEKMLDEIRDIGSSLLNISKNIEKLRSKKTTFHGKTEKDYIIKDSLYAYFIINTISTIGLFLISFYNKKYNNIDVLNKELEQEEEINIEDIPF